MSVSEPSSTESKPAIDTSTPPLFTCQRSRLAAPWLRLSASELFISSKIWCSSAHPHLVLPALRKTLENLGMEYIDLFLIHWPGSVKPSAGMEFPPKREDVVPMDFKSVWEAMEECHKHGLAKSIGVSNFSCKKLDQLLAVAKIPPAVNQVELSPVWQQKRLREYCEAKGIRVVAYSPLGSGSSIECEALKEIANARGKSVAQVMSF